MNTFRNIHPLRYETAEEMVFFDRDRGLWCRAAKLRLHLVNKRWFRSLEDAFGQKFPVEENKTKHSTAA